MNFTRLVDNEFLAEMLLGRCLKAWERKKLSEVAKKLRRVPTARECFEIVKYGKILTPEQRELMKQNEAWLQESYGAERMDCQRESWLFKRAL